MKTARTQIKNMHRKREELEKLGFRIDDREFLPP
jgi:hypothetical protein